MHRPACPVPNRSETSTNQNFRLKGKTIKRNKQNGAIIKKINSLNIYVYYHILDFEKMPFTFVTS